MLGTYRRQANNWRQGSIRRLPFLQTGVLPAFSAEYNSLSVLKIRIVSQNQRLGGTRLLERMLRVIRSRACAVPGPGSITNGDSCAAADRYLFHLVVSEKS